MNSTIGKNIKVNIWGGSHEPAIGVDITGLPQGTEINMTQLKAFLKRRAPGGHPFATKRKEADEPIPIKGLSPKNTPSKGAASNGTPPKEARGNRPDPAHQNSGRQEMITPPKDASDILEVTANTISFEIKNSDMRSSDYKSLRAVPRPGHADYTARIRYGNSLNMAGGGPFSARMTAPLCIAGGIALQMLKRRGIEIGAHIFSIGNVNDTPFDPVNIDPEIFEQIRHKNMAVISDEAKIEMQKEIWQAMEEKDSIGGIVEVCAVGLPPGIGGAMYDGLESTLAPIFFGIPAVKGIEFGAGFGASSLRGSQNNDPFYYEHNVVKTTTNNHGGILGGITSGMPLTARLAFKPTPSIARPQRSVDLDKHENTELKIKGRHDPCVVIRAVPVTEAALALGILDCMMEV